MTALHAIPPPFDALTARQELGIIGGVLAITLAALFVAWVVKR